MSLLAAADSFSRRWTLAAAIGITLFAATLRLVPLGESLWIDELHTAWCALADLDEVGQKAAMGNQAPLFFWLEWLLVRILGPSELALRLPSLIAGSLLPLALYFVARRWSSALVGLTAAAVVAIDPLAIFYATEARPYALVQLLGVLHVGLTGQLIARPSGWRRAGWIGLAAVLFHLHYTAGLLIVAEAVAYLVAVRVCRPQVAYPWRSGAMDLAAVAALALPALGNLSAISARRANWAEFVPQADLWQLLLWWPLAAGGLFLVAAALYRRTIALPVVLGLCWAAVPLVLAWLATASDLARLFYPRYLLVVQPAAALLGAWCVELVPGRAWKWLLAPLLVAGAALYGEVPQRLISEGKLIAPRNEDWRGAVDWLNEQLPRRAYPVLVDSGLIEARELEASQSERLRDYLVFPVTSLYALDVHRDELAPIVARRSDRIDQTTEMLMLHRGGGWLIVRGKKESAVHIGAAIAQRLAQLQVAGGSTDWRATAEWSGGRVHIVCLEAAQP